MTISLPPDNFIDKILKIFGIQRKIILPKDNQDQSEHNPYVTTMAHKENLIQTLLRIYRH